MHYYYKNSIFTLIIGLGMMLGIQPFAAADSIVTPIKQKSELHIEKKNIFKRGAEWVWNNKGKITFTIVCYLIARSIGRGINRANCLEPGTIKYGYNTTTQTNEILFSHPKFKENSVVYKFKISKLNSDDFKRIFNIVISFNETLKWFAFFNFDISSERIKSMIERKISPDFSSYIPSHQMPMFYEWMQIRYQLIFLKNNLIDKLPQNFKKFVAPAA